MKLLQTHLATLSACRLVASRGLSSSRRGFTSRQYVLAAAVVAIVSAAGFAGYLYYRSNSPHQLAEKARIALEQHDSSRAIDFLQRALDKNPSGEVAITLRNLMARAKIDAGREADARPYLQEALTLQPDNPGSLDLLAESCVHSGFRKLAQASKPLTEASITDILATISEELAILEKLPATARNQIAQAQLHRLAFMIVDDQLKGATARLAAAKLAQDPIAIDKSSRQVAAIQNPVRRRERAVELLRAALKQNPKDAKAAQFLVQYEYQDHHYAEALALYSQLKADNVGSPDLVITAANIMIADSARQAARKARFADAQKELESYLADHPKDASTSHVLVAIGQTLLEQDKIAEAAAMAARAAAQSPGDLDAQILLVNAKLRERKTAEALALVSPLANSNGNVPQVWYLLGLANSEAGDLRAAEEAFKKALQLNPGFTAARRALLTNDIRSQNTDAAVILASQVLKEDRYFVPAWEVTAQDLEKHGQADRARNFLAARAADPELPAENRPEVIQLLVRYGITDAAEALLATLPPTDDSTLSLRAAVAAAAGQVNKARDLLAKDVAANPDNIDLRLRYTELLLRSRLAPDARAQLDRVAASAAKAPLSAPDWLRVAWGYLYLRLPEQANAAAKQALVLQPRSLEAQSLQQQATAMLTGAPATQDSIQAINPDQATLADTIRLASAALGKKDYEGTLTLARAGLSKDAGNVSLRQISARALAALGKYDQAVDEIVAAAQAHKESPASFAVFVELFPTPDAALKGLGYGNQLQSINPALGNWAMGRLAEISGDASTPLRYYRAGVEAASKTLDPGAAKDVLFRAILNLHAQSKDLAALKNDAATYANEPAFTVGIRLLAADHLRVLGDSAGTLEQLDKLVAALSQTPAANVLQMIAQRYRAINHGDKALALLEKYLANHKQDPQFLDAYAAILEQRDPDKALTVREQLVALDASNPQYKIALAQTHAALGNEVDAFRILDEARGLGETGRQLATGARLKLLISLGLLHEAAGELAANKSPTTDDFASMLAIGQGWAQLSKPQDAKKILAAIPLYAAEYPAAVATLAALDSAAGNFDAAIKALIKQAGLETELFQTYLRAGNPGAALDLARKQLGLFPVHTPPWRNWTIYAATAARESRQYQDAVSLLRALDPEGKKAAAFDIALLQLLQNQPEQAALTAESITDEVPTYNRSTILLLANSSENLTTKPAILLDAGPASTVYAFLSAHFPRQLKAIPEIAGNSRLIPADVDGLLVELSASPEFMVVRLRQLALAQRLIESGWTTRALALLDEVDKSPPTTTLALLQRHRAYTELHRTAEAAAIAAKLTARIKEGASVAPSVRILLAAGAVQKEDYPAAIAALEPLAALNRPDILTTLATFHEKLGQLDKAIALHRQVRQLDPGNILAANNLAYTLAAAHPTDKAALSEAKTAIQSAIDKAPRVPAFQDTLAWIEILSSQPAQGAKRLAKNLPALRLDPAVHYHLGIAYAKLGQNDLARLHLQNVEHLAQSKTSILELPLAAEALKTLASTQK